MAKIQARKCTQNGAAWGISIVIATPIPHATKKQQYRNISQYVAFCEMLKTVLMPSLVQKRNRVSNDGIMISFLVPSLTIQSEASGALLNWGNAPHSFLYVLQKHVHSVHPYNKGGDR